MRLNSLTPSKSRAKSRKRLGRGRSSGWGKTSGRGQKGQHARSGGYHKVGFEGGQMPLQRRLPKVGFRSRTASTRAELRLDQLAGLESKEAIDLLALKKAGRIKGRIEKVKVIKAGELTEKVELKGIAVTKGAREVIEKAGGSISE
ncbi:MAG: 50S ribosomal protein L15 [Gammaproteobacteria bacterium]|nr:50S ribosomal protein L15 [Gammaproteobacteria bacterium]